jgi:glutamate racemase
LETETDINNNCIVFFDSGIGGLPYLKTAMEHMPGEHFVYVADRENFPYGEKAAGEIIKAVISGVEKIIYKEDPKIIVIACNTASVIALEDLREKFRVPFIGVVPAVKPAAQISVKKRLAVVATSKTVQDGYLKNLIEQFARDCEVILVSAGNVINFVEHRLFDTSRQEKLEFLESTLSGLKKEDVDVTVLACTHFLLLEDEFSEVLGKGIKVIDSREGVINQLERIMKKFNLERHSVSVKNKFYITGIADPEEMYKRISKEFGLEFSGTI